MSASLSMLPENTTHEGNTPEQLRLTTNRKTDSITNPIIDICFPLPNPIKLIIIIIIITNKLISYLSFQES